MDNYGMLLKIGFVAAMLAAAAVDWRRRIIPNGISVGGMIASLLVAAMTGNTAESALGAAAGLGSGLLVRYAGSVFLQKRIAKAAQADPEVDCAFGMGDVKLLGFVGAFCGPRGLFFVWLAGSVAGSLAGIWLKVRKGDAVMPLAPFIAAGSIAYFLRDMVLR